MAPVYGILFFLLCHLKLLLLAAGDGNGYQGKCPPSFDCGYLGNIGFPFTTTERRDCGLLAIQNCGDGSKIKMIQPGDTGKWFNVIWTANDPTKIAIGIRDNELYKLLESESCEAFTYNYTLPPAFNFTSFHVKYRTTLFRCNRTLHVKPPAYMNKSTKCPDYDLYYSPFISNESYSSLAACIKVQLPIKDVPEAKDPFSFVTADFPTEVQISDVCADCHYHQGGQCQLDHEGKFYCANGYGNAGKSRRVLIGATAASAAGVAVLMVLACCFRRKIIFPLFWKENPTHRIIEEFLKENGPLPTARYSYSELKKMTNSFRNKLGQGGFGCVYKGKLRDGSVVAVKVLSESKGNGEEFINEVASISRTSHVNIVRLVGFCLDSSERALIYEFMPNGSLEKFIYAEENPLKVDRQLDCQTLYDIAIGVARGLEYLHKGCNTRILHFDIKPHNILLDEDFCPKISDFGLAKICTRKESIVSIFGARGTAGYIAPEVFSRNFGAVSHKSDVYSYGMMVLEMVGRIKNINAEVDRSSEIYFPHWIYNRLRSNQELGLRSVRNESDNEKMRKMTIVSLWCIQTSPSTRPAISEVVEMLEGRVESLQMPPKPFWFSPSASPSHC